MILIFLILVPGSFLLWFKLKCDWRLASTYAWCDASEAFDEWRRRNPGTYFGLSEEGRRILCRYIEADTRFLETHKFYDGKIHHEWLVSLLNDLPPKPPHDLPAEKSAGNFY